MQDLIVSINVYFSDFMLHLVHYKNIEDLAPRLRTLTENLRYVSFQNSLDFSQSRVNFNSPSGTTGHENGADGR
jgi:hypothetical protein